MTSSITTNIAHNSYKSIVENNWSRLINKKNYFIHQSVLIYIGCLKGYQCKKDKVSG